MNLSHEQTKALLALDEVRELFKLLVQSNRPPALGLGFVSAILNKRTVIIVSEPPDIPEAGFEGPMWQGFIARVKAHCVHARKHLQLATKETPADVERARQINKRDRGWSWLECQTSLRLLRQRRRRLPPPKLRWCRAFCYHTRCAGRRFWWHYHYDVEFRNNFDREIFWQTMYHGTVINEDWNLSPEETEKEWTDNNEPG